MSIDDIECIFESGMVPDSSDVFESTLGYQCLELSKKEIKENDIFMVKAKGSRIGWLFPIIAISSNNHDFKSNRHFHTYAFVAMQFLAKTHFDEFKKTNLNIRFDQIELSRNYVFVICTERAKTVGFNSRQSLLSLAKFGFFDSDADSLKYPYSEDFEKTDSILIDSIEMPDNLDGPFSVVLTNYLPSINDPIFAFFTIYQLFEILIADLHELEKQILIGKIPDLGSRPLRDTLEKLKGYLNESTALHKLAESTIDSDFSDKFSDARKKLIPGTVIETSDGWIDSIYALRNSMFHSYLNTAAKSPEIVAGILPTLLAALFETTKAHSQRRRDFTKALPNSAMEWLADDRLNLGGA